MKTEWIRLEDELAMVEDGGLWVLVDLEDNTVYDKDGFESKFGESAENYFADIDDLGPEADMFETDFLKYPSGNLSNRLDYFGRTIQY